MTEEEKLLAQRWWDDKVENARKLPSYLTSRKKQLMRLAITCLILAIGSIAFLYNRYQKDYRAQSELFQAVFYFEKEDFEKALQGDGVYAGFLDIIKEYRFTDAANLAHFYAGVCYMQQQAYQEALTHLKRFSARDSFLQARAWSLIGDIWVEQQAYKKAIRYFKKAAKYKMNAVFTPIYLIKAALAYEALTEYWEACEYYNQVMFEFPNTPHYDLANKHIGRLEGIMKKPYQPRMRYD